MTKQIVINGGEVLRGAIHSDIAYQELYCAVERTRRGGDALFIRNADYLDEGERRSLQRKGAVFI